MTNVIHHGEAQIQYCPTSDMVTDFFTKPFQGSLFQKFQNEILNVDANIKATSNVLEQECVGAQPPKFPEPLEISDEGILTTWMSQNSGKNSKTLNLCANVVQVSTAA